MALASPSAGSAPKLVCFTNCQCCLAGELVSQDLYFSPEQGNITPNYYYRTEGVQRIDLGGAIVAPGFLDLQINGMLGVHFTHLGHDDDQGKVSMIAKRELQAGVTGWWATVPTMAAESWQKVRDCLSDEFLLPSGLKAHHSFIQILPSLTPRSFEKGATLLGAHCEGPYLHPSKKGAHNSAHFESPTTTSPESLYGAAHLFNTIKMITLAPELRGSITLIGHLRENYPPIVISLGHSSASYAEGLAALDVGATALTHTFNAMPPLHHREPGLAGLMTTGSCYYSVIADGIHLHPATLSLAFRNDPSKCILITDSIELAGLPDGVYPGHGQILQRQRKEGNKVTIEGTETLIGSCCMLDECVRNLVSMTGCGLAEAVRCVTENVAQMMGEGKRGRLEAGRRADFAILDARGFVKETWVSGKRVWSA